MANKIFNVTAISEIIRCTKEYYERVLSRQETSLVQLPEYCLFIVSNEGNSSLEVYYGARKLKDFIVVNSLPEGRDYPNNKLYIYVSKSGIVKNIQYKNSKGDLISISKKLLLKEVTVSSSAVRVLWSTGDASNLVVISEDGVATQLVSDIDSKVRQLAYEKHSTKWESI